MFSSEVSAAAIIYQSAALVLLDAFNCALSTLSLERRQTLVTVTSDIGHVASDISIYTLGLEYVHNSLNG